MSNHKSYRTMARTVIGHINIIPYLHCHGHPPRLMNPSPLKRLLSQGLLDLTSIQSNSTHTLEPNNSECREYIKNVISVKHQEQRNPLQSQGSSNISHKEFETHELWNSSVIQRIATCYVNADYCFPPADPPYTLLCSVRPRICSSQRCLVVRLLNHSGSTALCHRLHISVFWIIYFALRPLVCRTYDDWG